MRFSYKKLHCQKSYLPLCRQVSNLKLKIKFVVSGIIGYIEQLLKNNYVIIKFQLSCGKYLGKKMMNRILLT